MSKFKAININIPGLKIIEPTFFEDQRGYFLESYNKRAFEDLGIYDEFIQDNHSCSARGVLRGIHYQKKLPQGKLVRVTRGSVWDVAIDLRKESLTYKKWYGIELSEKNKKIFYIPEGFGHGFLTLEDNTEFQYKCTNFYFSEYDSGIKWNDPDLKIDWPFEKYKLNYKKVIISKKDENLKSFLDYSTE